MTTLLRTVSDADARPRPSSRSGRRGRVLAVAVVAVVVALGGAALWVWVYYQPVSATRGGGYGAGLTAGGGYDSIAIENTFGTDFRIIAPEPGAEIAMLFPLHNTGPLGVTIVDVGQPFNPTGVVDGRFRVAETTGGHATRPTDATEQTWIAVTPFALPPGGYSQIRVTFNVLTCATENQAPGSLSSVSTVPVTVRILGSERVVDVPLPYAVSIESLPHCPYPTDRLGG